MHSQKDVAGTANNRKDSLIYRLECEVFGQEQKLLDGALCFGLGDAAR